MTEIDVKLAALERLIASTIIEIGKISPQNIESTRRIMMDVEKQLLGARSLAQQNESHPAHAAYDYFEQLSHAILGQLPHHGKH